MKTTTKVPRTISINILWVVGAITLCAIPCLVHAVVYDSWDIFGGEHWLYPGDSITEWCFIYAGTVHIYGGSVPEGIDVCGGTVKVYGQNFVDDDGVVLPYDQPWSPPGGASTLTDSTGNISLLFRSNLPITLVEWPTGGGDPETIEIDIKPYDENNVINLGSNGVVPVAILTTAEFDATTIDPGAVTLAGAGVAVRGNGNKLLSSTKDVNGDGLLDLEVKVDTENLDPGTFQDGMAVVQVTDTDGETVIYEGWDHIAIVPPE